MTDKKFSPRRTAFEILKNIDRSGSYSNLELASQLRGSNYDARDSGFIAALVYGVLERQITLDFILSRYLSKPVAKARFDVRTLLRLGAYQIVFMDKVPDSAAVNECVKLAKSGGCAFAAGMINAVLRKVAGDDGTWRTAGWTVRYSCPQALIDLWVDAYGEGTARGILESSFGGTDTYLRVNTLRTTAGQLIESLHREQVEAEQVEGMPNTLRVAHSGALEYLRAYREGLFHVQGIPSQICAALLDVRSGMRVADVCAAPGGKSFTLAQMMENQGYLASFDLHPHRIKLIERGAQRLGIGIIRAAVRDAASQQAEEDPFDRVLCDVPCSGLGDIASKPELRYKTTFLSDELSAVQYAILEQSARLVVRGGRLVYSTCTLNPAENEDVCTAFLESHPEFSLLPARYSRARITAGGMMTFLPQDFGGNGFFAAVLEKVR
ncbi:MAG: 16S rRNA (cytosine(967)-C(5))-methyltransferase RsmB [Clostridia bacterium]